MSEVDKLVEETNKKIQDRKRQGRPATTDPDRVEAERKKYFDMVFGNDQLPPEKTSDDVGKYCVYSSQRPSKRGRGGGRGRGRGRPAGGGGGQFDDAVNDILNDF